jgi:hypothetical protein
MSSSLDFKNVDIQTWILNNLQEQEIEQQLLSKGFDPESIKNYIQEFKQTKYARRQTIGLFLLIAGGLIGFLGFILAVINPIPSFYNAILVGSTSLAAIVIFLGLYFVVE